MVHSVHNAVGICGLGVRVTAMLLRPLFF